MFFELLLNRSQSIAIILYIFLQFQFVLFQHLVVIFQLILDNLRILDLLSSHFLYILPLSLLQINQSCHFLLQTLYLFAMLFTNLFHHFLVIFPHCLQLELVVFLDIVHNLVSSLALQSLASEPQITELVQLFFVLRDDRFQMEYLLGELIFEGDCLCAQIKYLFVFELDCRLELRYLLMELVHLIILSIRAEYLLGIQPITILTALKRTEFAVAERFLLFVY